MDLAKILAKQEEQEGKSGYLLEGEAFSLCPYPKHLVPVSVTSSNRKWQVLAQVCENYLIIFSSYQLDFA